MNIMLQNSVDLFLPMVFAKPRVFVLSLLVCETAIDIFSVRNIKSIISRTPVRPKQVV